MTGWLIAAIQGLFDHPEVPGIRRPARGEARVAALGCIVALGFQGVASAQMDTTPPTFSRAEVLGSGRQLDIYFSENVDYTVGNQPPLSAFDVTVDGQSVTLTGHGPGVSGEWVLNFGTSIKTGQTVLLSYTDPTAGDDTQALQDGAGNDVATFTNQSVANNSTQAAVAPDAPTGLAASAAGHNQIDLSWTAPYSGGSPITGYKIEVSPDNSSWSDLVADTNSTSTTHSHTGLSAGDTRHYRVSAINSVGTGSASNVDSATTHTTPGAPTSLSASAVGENQIDLSWTAPASDGGTAITGYRIEVSTDGGTSWSDLVANTGNTSVSYSHTGLSAGTTRHYRISAINSVGTGNPSNVDSATTSAVTAPGVPTGLSVRAVGPNRIDLSWSAPANTGGRAITGYRIEVSNDGSTGWSDLAADTGNTSVTYSHTGLSPETTRHYRVSAINSVGTGNPSSVASATTGRPRQPSPTTGPANTAPPPEPTVSASCQPCEVRPGDEVRLRAAASDLPGALTWSWSAPKGSFIGGTDSASVRWRAPEEAGRFSIRVRASNESGDSASDRVTVEVVNDAPAFESSEFVFELPENRDGSRQPVAVGAVAAADPDGDALTYELASGDPARFTIGTADGAVRYVGPGEDFESAVKHHELTVRARDPYGAAAEARVLVSVTDVNDAPAAVGTIPDQSLDEGGGAVTVDLGPFFADEDGDALAYRAESSDPGVAAAAVSGSVLTLTPVVYGAAVVTVTAEDAGGLSATQAFTVGVSDRLVRGVVKETLAGLARSHLASARMTLGRRASAGGQAGSRLTVRGRTVPLGTAEARAAAERMLLSWASRAGGYRTAGAVPGATPAGSWSGAAAGLDRRAGSLAGGTSDPWLRGTEFLLALGGQDGDGDRPGRQWQIWGQGDLQAFDGGGSEVSDYDGELWSGYAGVDTGLTERLRAGVAVSRSRGAGDWRVGGSSGSLETTLTAVHPYAQWSDGTTSVWATAGGGVGEAENERHSGAVGSSELDLLLGLAEVRRRLATVAGGFELGVRADAGRAQLRTAAGSETVAGHTAAVNQARVGVEVSHALRPESGPSLFPFGEAHVRHDSGAGQTGTGLELVGGARVEHGRVRLDARGRLLVLHSADGYRERGVGVMLSVGDGGEEGLSLSLAPRWGQAEAAGTLWQEQLYRRYRAEPAAEEWALDARGGYGMRLSSGRLLRWFGSLGQSRYGFRFLVGGRVDVLGDRGTAR